METMTIKRNGVYIIFPARPHIKPAKNVGKRCIHCGDAVWRNDVNYCWECYKYEHFESK